MEMIAVTILLLIITIYVLYKAITLIKLKDSPSNAKPLIQQQATSEKVLSDTKPPVPEVDLQKEQQDRQEKADQARENAANLRIEAARIKMQNAAEEKAVIKIKVTEDQLIGHGIKSGHDTLRTAFDALTEHKGINYEMPLDELTCILDEMGVRACAKVNHPTTADGQIVASASATQEERCFVKGYQMLVSLLMQSFFNLHEELGHDCKVYLAKVGPQITVATDMLLRDNPEYR